MKRKAGTLLVVSIILILIVGVAIFGYFYLSKPRVISETSVNSLSCNDPDGNEIYKKGITTYTYEDPNEPGEIPTRSSPDWCEYNHPKTDKRVGLIRESYCEGNTYHQIFSTCGRGFVCRNGACVKGDKDLTVCVDSDGGKIPSVKGELVGYGGSGEDSCWISTNKQNPEEDGSYTPDCVNSESVGCYVYEYYCEGDSKRYETIPCDSCVGGRCV